ncbi:SusD/RagB family nutrient-binding outer membrane lipoprotein [Bacteroides reticulotermitis]|uniref:SusD/RagB family nutrient-binding outer membrane lipoprotein n=2 Tax=Bacteroides reticulotermitis TaxID=1133319 RepID=W4V094_9BACE|nr:SusD/RagB family nutrient-binding outer membrane lipoprotein [Bacteroides reticulotermitis]MBB4045903.1 hypothetical protein [Bacteroides reticulotermitis]GAE86497.1 hypothetical protein JCM10512_5010 [Bacteroides reticulotermitis JCM 10512]
MKRNSTIAKFIAVGAILLSTAACTADFEKYNKNPHEPDLDEMNQGGYLLGALILNLQDMMMPEQENLSQYVDCLMPGGLSGYVADSNLGTGWSGRFATYNPSDNWLRVPFNDFYEKFYPNYFQMKDQVDDEFFLSLAELFRIATMLRVTDTYGPIPYSQVGVANAIRSPYDSQKAIYNKMFEDLDNTIAILTKYSTQQFNSGFDRVYGGNTVAWVKFANSLKLRMAIRISYANPTLAQQKAEEAVNSEIGVMTAASDGAFRKVADHNPWERFMPNWSDARISADLTCYMNGYSDPRRPAYYGISTFTAVSGEKYTGTEKYVGLRRGIRQGEFNSWSHGYSCMKVSTSDDILIFPASEVAFLRAEGALRGWNMGGTAKELYETGIRTSFEERKVNGADTYMNNNLSVAEGYTDPLKGSSGQPYDYSGSTNSLITVAWDEGAGFEKNLERIITQKWIAIFPNCMEAWSEYRRTGYPKLMPMAANLSGGIVNDAEGARRLPYPTNEYRENGENVKAAVSTLAQESNNKKGDTMATHIWWDCK